MSPALLPLRGEIWLVNLDPTIGNEIQKTRPVTVVSSNHIRGLDLRIAVPITSWQDIFTNKRWMVKLEATAANGLNNTSAAVAFQVKSLAIQRFRKKLGVLSAMKMENIEEALKLVMELS